MIQAEFSDSFLSSDYTLPAAAHTAPTGNFIIARTHLFVNEYTDLRAEMRTILLLPGQPAGSDAFRCFI